MSLKLIAGGPSDGGLERKRLKGFEPDLLHGKQTVRSRAFQESPGKEQFPSYRWSAILPTFTAKSRGFPD
jgi:hypothetical protein